MRTALLLIGLLLPLGASAQNDEDALGAVPSRGPVIDMHLHSGPGSAESRSYTVQEGESPDEARLRALLDDMRRHGVVLGVVGGPASFAAMYKRSAPERFVASVSFPCTDGLDPHLVPCFESGEDWPDLDWLRREVEAGRVGALGELYNVYAGVSPTDSRMAPFYALAAEYDIPIAVHADSGPPPFARTPGCCPDFNGDYGDPAHYRSVLERHPTLRLYLMHVINPEFIGAAIELMDAYPNVYVDLSPMHLMPLFAHGALRMIVEAGHADRIMFGSDFLGSIGEGVEVIEAATFLTEEQKRAIYYDNAARFLQLTEEEIARHHSEKRVAD